MLVVLFYLPVIWWNLSPLLSWQHFQKVIPHQFDSCPDKLILRAYQIKYIPKKMKKYVSLWATGERSRERNRIYVTGAALELPVVLQWHGYHSYHKLISFRTQLSPPFSWSRVESAKSLLDTERLGAKKSHLYRLSKIYILELRGVLSKSVVELRPSLQTERLLQMIVSRLYNDGPFKNTKLTQITHYENA